MIPWSRNLRKSHVPCVAPLTQRTRKTSKISTSKAHSPSLAFSPVGVVAMLAYVQHRDAGKGTVQGPAPARGQCSPLGKLFPLRSQ